MSRSLYTEAARAENAAKPVREFRLRQTRTGTWYAEQDTNGKWTALESGATSESCRANLIESMTHRRGWRVSITEVIPHPKFS